MGRRRERVRLPADSSTGASVEPGPDLLQAGRRPRPVAGDLLRGRANVLLEPADGRREGAKVAEQTDGEDPEQDGREERERDRDEDRHQPEDTSGASCGGGPGATGSRPSTG